jgi:hypothetical protein
LEQKRKPFGLSGKRPSAIPGPPVFKTASNPRWRIYNGNGQLFSLVTWI